MNRNTWTDFCYWLNVSAKEMYGVFGHGHLHDADVADFYCTAPFLSKPLADVLDHKPRKFHAKHACPITGSLRIFV